MGIPLGVPEGAVVEMLDGGPVGLRVGSAVGLLVGGAVGGRVGSEVVGFGLGTCRHMVTAILSMRFD